MLFFFKRVSFPSKFKAEFAFESFFLFFYVYIINHICRKLMLLFFKQQSSLIGDDLSSFEFISHECY